LSLEKFDARAVASIDDVLRNRGHDSPRRTFTRRYDDIHLCQCPALAQSNRKSLFHRSCDRPTGVLRGPCFSHGFGGVL